MINDSDSGEIKQFSSDDAKAVEAILFASGCPVTYEKLAEALGFDKEEIKKQISAMTGDYAARGIDLVTYDESCVLCSKPEYETRIKAALDLRRSGTLSNSALETLAVVARNQPVTRSYIEQVRGIDSSYAVNLLNDRGLIEPVGRLDVPGKPILYATTEAFLRCFGINSLSELPDFDVSLKE